MRTIAKSTCLQVLLIVLLIPFAGVAQSADLIQNASNRSGQSLNGYWNIIVDPYENGYYDYRYQPKENGYFKNEKADSRQDRVEYNFDESDRLKVPGDWNSQRKDLWLYEGTVWYHKNFTYDLHSDHRLFLHFGAVNYEAIVYVNGQQVGKHEGGFTPFIFEITDLVQTGKNFVVVKVDNSRRRDGVPTLNTDWWNYGGITRDVKLIDVPEIFIEDYMIQLDPENPDRITGFIQLDNDVAKQSIEVQIPAADIVKTFTTDKQGRVTLDFAAEVSKWSPEDPKVYNVVITTAEDTVQDRIGFRTINTEGTDILLNGEPVFLRGISIHEKAPQREGRAYTKADARKLLGWAKELGCNYVRLAHYPHNKHMVRMADEMGLMVWSEIPVYWTIQWENEDTYQVAEQQLTEMISRDRNRASVILWSMSNETPLSKSRLKFLTKLTEKARSMDHTRLLTAALEQHYINDTTLMIDDPFGKELDVIGINEYIGWYDGLPSKAPKLEWKSVYDKPMVISEFGAGALQGYHGKKDERWTEDFQQSLYENQIKMLTNIDFLRGMSPWILQDFRSPRRHLPDIQDFWNRKGLISDHGVKKKAYHTLKEFYESKKEE